MTDEAGRWTAEDTVLNKDVEIRELKHLLEARDNRIKELESQVVQLKSLNYPKDGVAKTVTLTDGTKVIGGYLVDDVDYAVADESEDSFTEQLSFTYNQE